MDPMILDGASLKKKAEYELDAQAKRPRPKEIPLLKMPKELILEIFSYLNFHALTRFGLASKSCKNISANMPLWKNLCSHLKLEQATWQTANTCFMQALANNNELALSTPANTFCESKDIYLQYKAIHALDEFHMLKAQVKKVSIQTQIEEKITYLNAIQAHEGYNPLSLEDSKISEDLETLVDSNLSLTIQAIALKYLILRNMKIKRDIATKGLDLRLVGYINEKNIANWIKLECFYLLGLLRVTNRSDLINDLQAIQYLQYVSQNINACSITRTLANFCIAKAMVQNKTQVITQNDAAKIFYNCIQNHIISEFIQKKAGYFLAKMRFEKGTELINDDEMIEILQQTRKNRKMPSIMRKKSEEMLAHIQFEKPSSLIEDSYAAKYFLDASQENTIPKTAQNLAQYRLAEMRFQNRTNLITDEEAIKVFYETSQNDQMNDAIYKNCLSYIAYMVSEGRIVANY